MQRIENLSLEREYHDYGVMEDLVIEVPESKVFSSLDVHLESGQFLSYRKAFRKRK